MTPDTQETGRGPLDIEAKARFLRASCMFRESGGDPTCETVMAEPCGYCEAAQMLAAQQRDVARLSALVETAQAAIVTMRRENIRLGDALIATLEHKQGSGTRETWQPIETGPKDGTMLWVFKDGSQFEAKWLEWDFSNQDHPVQPAKKGAGWIDGMSGAFYVYPTHWMPLPAAPAGPARVPAEAAEAAEEGERP